MDHFGSISTDKSLIVGETVKKEINIKQSDQLELQTSETSKAENIVLEGFNGKSNKLCPKCSKTFKTPSKMRRHFSSVHEGLRPFNCKVCDKTFAQKEHMNVHMKNAHEPKELNF